jgi:beta-lactamase superfamily II metal-dependent hydrolase
MFDEPKVMFWPVGTGDSTTVVIQDGIVLQVDLRDFHSADEADDDHAALIDALVENLPTVDGKPYLSTFALTHPDKDHIQGFEDLLDRVTIGEIWFTPRVFIENDQDLCDDAVASKKKPSAAFRKRSTRAATLAQVIASGSSDSMPFSKKMTSSASPKIA